MISRTGPFIIEEYHLRGTTEFIREIYPHPVLGRPFLIRFSEYLDPAFVTMDISAFQKFLFHQLIQRFRYLSAQFMIQFAIVFVERSRSYLANSLS